MYFFPCSSVSGVRSLSTSSWYSDLPISAPSAMAMGRPIMPVPGIPTPIAFFRMLALSITVIFSGRLPSISVALATQSATAIGSVQPTAGTTSRAMRSRICFLQLLSIISSFCFFLSKGMATAP